MSFRHTASAFLLLILGQAVAIGMAMLWLRSKEDVPCPKCDGTGVATQSGPGWMSFSECNACDSTGVRGR